jgi:hypothetical protein
MRREAAPQNGVELGEELGCVDSRRKAGTFAQPGWRFLAKGSAEEIDGRDQLDANATARVGA